MAMKKAIKKKWIKMLRSGEYEQASGCLRVYDNRSKTKNRFCCLGVLAIACGGNIPRNKTANWITWNRKPQNGALDDDLVHLVGMTEETRRTVIQMNDTERRSFDEIALYVEETA